MAYITIVVGVVLYTNLCSFQNPMVIAMKISLGHSQVEDLMAEEAAKKKYWSHSSKWGYPITGLIWISTTYMGQKLWLGRLPSILPPILMFTKKVTGVFFSRRLIAQIFADMKFSNPSIGPARRALRFFATRGTWWHRSPEIHCLLLYSQFMGNLRWAV